MKINNKSNEIKCPFCGRIKAVEYIEGVTYHCTYCLKLFNAKKRVG
jgi:uncharacterized Zn-finger protein